MPHYLKIKSAILIFCSCNLEDGKKQNIIPTNPVDTVKHIREKGQAKYFSDLAVTLQLLPIDENIDSFDLNLWVSSIFV